MEEKIVEILSSQFHRKFNLATGIHEFTHFNPKHCFLSLVLTLWTFALLWTKVWLSSEVSASGDRARIKREP
jgi:hypothetical protein